MATQLYKPYTGIQGIGQFSTLEKTQNHGGTTNSKFDLQVCSSIYEDVKQVYQRDFLNPLEKVKDFTTTADYQKYGFLPGDQIFYGGAFGIGSLTHHAIYIGNGIVVEMGSGPKSCKGAGATFKKQMYGFSNLKDFARRAKKNKSQILQEVEANKPSRKMIIERLRRVSKLLGPQSYSIFTNNCQHTANFISYGKFQSKQANMVLIPIIISALSTGVWGLYKYGNCINGTCKSVIVSNTGCSCEGPIYTTKWSAGRWKLGDKYCYVNKKLCKGGEKHGQYFIDRVSNDGKLRPRCIKKNFKYGQCDLDRNSTGRLARMGFKSKTKNCKRRRVRKNSDGSRNQEDIEHNRKCSEEYMMRDNPWMKEVLDKKNPKGYDKHLKTLITQNTAKKSRKKSKRRRSRKKSRRRRSRKKSKRRRSRKKSKKRRSRKKSKRRKSRKKSRKRKSRKKSRKRKSRKKSRKRRSRKKSKRRRSRKKSRKRRSKLKFIWGSKKRRQRREDMKHGPRYRAPSPHSSIDRATQQERAREYRKYKTSKIPPKTCSKDTDSISAGYR